MDTWFRGRSTGPLLFKEWENGTELKVSSRILKKQFVAKRKKKKIRGFALAYSRVLQRAVFFLEKLI